MTDLPGTPKPLSGLQQQAPQPEEARVDVAPVADPQATDLTVPGVPEVEQGEDLTVPTPEFQPPPVEFMESDRSNTYLQHRERSSGANELDKVLSRVRSREGQAPEAAPQEGVQAETQAQDEAQAAGEVEAPQEQDIRISRLLGQEGFGAFVGDELVGAGTTEEEALAAGKEAIAPEGFGDKAVAVGKDVMRGLTEAPLQIAGGISDAVVETGQAIDSLSDWLDENVADLSVEVDLPFVDDDQQVKLTPGALAEAVMPEVAKAESVTGNAVRSISQFITGFVGAGKALKGAGVVAEGASGAARFVQAMAQGAIADFTVFDPHEQRLSNMIESVPELANPVTEFLAADPDDSEIEGRLKNAVEGLGLGALVDGLIFSLKTIRGARKARALQEEGVEQLQKAELAEQEVKFGTTEGRDFLTIGDPDVEDIVISRPTLASKIKETAGADPDIATPEPVWVDVVGANPTRDPIPKPPTSPFEDMATAELDAAVRGDGAMDSFDDFVFDALDELSVERLRAKPDKEKVKLLDSALKRAAKKGYHIEGLVDDVRVFQWDSGKKEWLQRAPDKDKDLDTVLALYMDSAGNRTVPMVEFNEMAQKHWVTTKIEPALSKEAKEGFVEEEELFINYARIDTPEDIQEAIKAMSNIRREGIEKAKRGVRTNVETELAAKKVDAFEVLVNRREGQPLNAEESLSLRQLWAQSGDTLSDAAKKAANNPSEANLFAFRKMVAVHDAIQKEVIAARTETARALQSWRIPAGGSVEKARAIQDVLATTAETPDVHREMARRISALADAEDFAALDEVVKRSVGARTYDAVVQAWINGLLSGPKTHLVNMMSNTSVIFNSMAERSVAARLGHVMGSDNAVEMGEATAQWFGLVQGLKDSFRISAKADQLGPVFRDVAGAEGMRGRAAAAREGLGRVFPAEEQGTVFRSIATGQSGFGLQKIDAPRQGALASEVWDVASDTALGRTLDTLNVVTQIPGRALGAEDELFKTIGYRMELHAQALRQARREVSAGMIPEAEFKGRISEIIENPPENIRLQALDAAAYQTFNGAPGKLSQTIMKYRDAAPVIGVLTAPFVRTVGNLLKYTYERTPLAPLMGEVRANIKAGGARRDMALAKISTGSTIMLIAADMAMSGQITGQGPADPQKRAAQRRSKIQPYSVKVGDRWFAYNRVDPIGTLIGLSADIVDITVNGDFDDDKWNEDVERAVIATVAAIGNNSMNESYMQGMANFVEAMADPTRNAEYWAGGIAGSIIPTGVAEVTRYQDPYMREARSMWDSIKARTPGMSDELPLRRDLWGRPIDRRSGLGATFDAVSPIYSKKEGAEPIDKELLRLGDAPSGMPRRTSLNGITINLDQYEGAYSRLVELAGNEVKLAKYGNKGAKDALNDVINGDSPFSVIYKLRTDGPDGGKMSFIRGVVQEYRAAAKDQLLDEFPQITVEVRRKKKAQAKWQMQLTQ